MSDANKEFWLYWIHLQLNAGVDIGIVMNEAYLLWKRSSRCLADAKNINDLPGRTHEQFKLGGQVAIQMLSGKQGLNKRNIELSLEKAGVVIDNMVNAQQYEDASCLFDKTKSCPCIEKLADDCARAKDTRNACVRAKVKEKIYMVA